MKKRLNRKASVLSRCIEPLEGRVMLTTNHLVFTSQPTSTTAGATLDPVITVAIKDASNKVVTGDSSNVTLSITDDTGPDGAAVSGTLTVAAVHGVASFSTISLNTAGSGGSAYKLTAKDGSLTSADSSSFSITPAAASKLVYHTQPADVKAGAAISPSVVVYVEDQYGNIVTNDFSHVALTVATGPTHSAPVKTKTGKVSSIPVLASLGGTVNVPANAGVATFSDLTLDTVGEYTIVAADAKLTTATSDGFSVSAGTAAQIAFVGAPASGAVGDLADFTVQVQDILGNVVSTNTSKVTVSILSGPDGATLGGTGGPNAVAGVASFTDLSLHKAGTYVLKAVDGSFDTISTAAFTLAAGTATQVAISQAPTDTVAGVLFSPVLTGAVEDQYGNVVTTDKSKVTAAIGSGPDGAVLGGTAVVAVVKGLATFPNLQINSTGTYTLTVADGSLTGDTSDSFKVTPSAASKLAIITGPADAVAGVKISPSIVVDVQDKFGNVVTTDTSTVALAVATGTVGATLSGTASIAAVHGVATLDSVKLNTVGKYTIKATDGVLAPAASGVFNITAAAAAKVSISALPASVVAGVAIPAVKVSVVDAFGNLVIGDTSSVTLAIADDTGPDGATLGGTATEAAVAGIATFSDLTLSAVDAGGTAYKLSASDGDLDDAASNSFSVTPAAASQVVFKKGPSNAVAGATESPAVTVLVEDKFGNVVTTDKSKVTLVLATGPSHTAPKKTGKKVSSVQVPATVSGTLSQTVVNGMATFSDLAFNFSGAYTLAATDAKLTSATSSSFTISPGAATQLAFGTQPVAAVAGDVLTTFTVQIEDAQGNVVTGNTSKVNVAFATGPDNAELRGTVQETAVAGVATFDAVKIPYAGTYTLGVTDGSLTAATSNAIVISPGAATQIGVWQGAGASSAVTAGVAIAPTFKVVVADPFGNIVTTDKSKIVASINTGPDGAAAPLASTVAVVGGVATFTGLSLTTAGSYQLTFTDGTFTAHSDHFTVSPSAATKIVFDQAPTAAVAGAKLGPSVTVDVEDKFGNVVPNDASPVVLTIGSAPVNGPVAALAAFHASSGVATFSKLAFSVAGNYTIRASDGALVAAVSAPFAISAGDAAKLVMTKGPTSVVAGVKIPAVTVQVDDKYGNPIAGDTSNVTVAVSSGPDGSSLGGTGTQAAVKGIGTFGDLTLNTAGRYRLTASDGSLTSVISSGFDVSAAAASQVVFDDAPTDTVAGSTTSPNVTVDVEDKFGNLVIGDSKTKVTVAVAGPTGATLTGTLTQTVTGGVATFNDLSPQMAGDSTLSAIDGKLTKATSDTFSVSPGTAAKLVFGTAPPVTTAAGATFSAVTVKVEDALGNVVTGNTSKVTLALASGPDGVTLGGTLQENAVAGVATFSDLAIQKVGAYTITATDGSLTNTTSPTTTITAGAAAKVVIGQAPTAAVAGVAIAPTMTALVEDQYGNTVLTDASKVTVAVSTGPDSAVITGTAIATAVKGVATFTGISLKTAGNYKLGFTDGSLTAATSSTFAISAAAAAKLNFTQPPTAAVHAVKFSPNVKVVVQDAFGNLVSGDTSNVSAAILTGATGATLGGTLTQAASSGVATFDDLMLDKAGTYTVKFSDGSLGTITSAPFVIS